MASLVYLKSKNGTMYVYENISFWDKKTKSQSQSTNVLDALTRKSEQYSLMVGAVAVERISYSHLQKVFSDDYRAILMCAYYLISEGQVLSKTER